MQPIVRRLLVDHARRTSWLWLLGCVAFVGSTCAYIDQQRSSGFWLYFLLSTVPLLTVHAGRSLYRYLPEDGDLALLPISKDQKGRFLWWVRIGVPGLVVSAANLLVLVGARTFSHFDTSPWTYAIWLLMPWGLFGLQMFVPTSNRFDAALIWIFGVAPVLLYAIAFLPHSPLAYLLELMAAVAGICAGIYSYSHTQVLNQFSTSTRGSSSALRNQSQTPGKRPLRSPWSQVSALYFSHPLTWGSLLLFSALMIFQRTISEVNQYAVPVTIGFILSVQPRPTRRIVDVLGQLRVLPVKLQTAAAMTYALSITPTLLVGVVGLTIIPEAATKSYAGVAVMLSTWSLLLLPTIIWQQFIDGQVAKVVSLFFWLAGMATTIVVVTTRVSNARLYFSLAILLMATIVIGYELTRRGIERMGRDKLRATPQFKSEH